ncbi:MAG: glycosyltransferase family 2 protein [Deltaproteobacteria bacterium]|nr:glycosyltransferase family 2 protein [Deltaproteobacteria bacterium]
MPGLLTEGVTQVLITIVMPCLNEEVAIGRTIDEIPFDTLKEMGCEVELLVIDGGSSDASGDLARSRGAKVLLSERGYGRQCRLGFDHAGGEIIVTADCDATYPLSNIPRILKTLKEGTFDFVTVNRFAGVAPGAMHTINRIGNIFLTSVANLLFRLNLKDSQSGMWAFRKPALEKMDLTSDGWPFAGEIKIEALRKLRSVEIPGSYKHRIGNTKLKCFRDGWTIFCFMVKKKGKEFCNIQGQAQDHQHS